MKELNSLALNIPETDKKRLVVLGGGFAGINLIKKLSNQFQVILLDIYNYHTFQPLLYQVATAGLEPDSIAGPLRKILEGRPDIHFRMLEAMEINPKNNEVRTNAGSLFYDYLVIATGTKSNYFGIKGVEKNAFVLKSIPNALDLRSHIFQQFEAAVMTDNQKEQEQFLTFAVVGGGPTGVEICGALAELKNKVLPKDYPTLDLSRMRIILIEGEPGILTSMSKISSQKAATYLKKLGVEIMLGTLTSDYIDNTVILNNGKKIKTKTLVWAAGVTGNIPKGVPETCIEKGKIRVNQFNQVQAKEADNIFALGDVCQMRSKDYPRGLPGVAQVAIQQGKMLAENLTRIENKETLIPFSYKDKGTLATIGRNKAVADIGKFKLQGFVGWFVWIIVHIMFLIGFRNKMVVFVNWLWSYVNYDRGIRLIVRPYLRKVETVKETNENLLQKV